MATTSRDRPPFTFFSEIAVLEDKIISNYWTKLSDYLPMTRETLTNHDILRKPSSIIVLSFNQRSC